MLFDFCRYSIQRGWLNYERRRRRSIKTIHRKSYPLETRQSSKRSARTFSTYMLIYICRRSRLRASASQFACHRCSVKHSFMWSTKFLHDMTANYFSLHNSRLYLSTSPDLLHNPKASCSARGGIQDSYRLFTLPHSVTSRAEQCQIDLAEAIKDLVHTISQRCPCRQLGRAKRRARRLLTIRTNRSEAQRVDRSPDWCRSGSGLRVYLSSKTSMSR